MVALPATAGAATVRVEPFREPPSSAPGCSKYMLCPADMLVFSAAPGEPNNISIAYDDQVAPRRFLVRDQTPTPLTPMEAGPGCERVEEQAVACTAEVLGPVDLGDLGDRITTLPLNYSGHIVSGGAGDDVLDVRGQGGGASGGEGDDVVTAEGGRGGPGDDVLRVLSGEGGAGDDLLRCLRGAFCALNGGPGNDRLTGGRAEDQLSGQAGRDLLQGRGAKDTLVGGLGNDRLFGGGAADVLRGGPGVDLLAARELRSRGERAARDDVNCGAGRHDRAVADRRDRVTRCERVTRRRRAR